MQIYHITDSQCFSTTKSPKALFVNLRIKIQPMEPESQNPINELIKDSCGDKKPILYLQYQAAKYIGLHEAKKLKGAPEKQGTPFEIKIVYEYFEYYFLSGFSDWVLLDFLVSDERFAGSFFTASRLFSYRTARLVFAGRSELLLTPDLTDGLFLDDFTTDFRSVDFVR